MDRIEVSAIHLGTAGIISFLAALVAMSAGIDVGLAKWLITLEAGVPRDGFPWRESPILSQVLHRDMQRLDAVMFLLLCFVTLAAWRVQNLRPWRHRLTYLLVTVALATGTVATIKHLSTLPCPWSLSIFGGELREVAIWSAFSGELPLQQCFPAGHASGGYCWLALAGLFPYRSRAFCMALVPGTMLGLVSGITQQLRGAHFLSHDLTTIGICLLSVALMTTVYAGPLQTR